MKNGLVIADSGPIFSLALADKLELLENIFDDIKIPQAVWNEISVDESKPFYNRIFDFFKNRVVQIKGFNDLTFLMDYGESQSVILYKELQANFLLIDDKKARTIAESLGINCIGTIGLLLIAKERGLIGELKPIFECFLKNNRYYSLDLLNVILAQVTENKIIIKEQ